jgi:branched-chain amino acid transport system ATP-binding protein
MLELDDIHTYYGESHVLKGVSLKVKKASVVTLLGRNGMGKTTTFVPSLASVHPLRGHSF